ncbi:MAG TPA: protease complex subunit PrcB family protein [Blastocatellia bacterium]|nr:protease complex subunit PrcB family protein [Blastocatellia bacterium]
MFIPARLKIFTAASVLMLAIGVAPAQELTSQLSLETLAAGQYSLQTAKANYVIVSRDQLKELWERARPLGSPLPEVDFSQKIVIAVFQGQTPSGSIRVSVTQVDKVGKRLGVHVRETLPGRGCPNTPDLGAPFHVVAIDRVIGKAWKRTDFEDEVVFLTCDPLP